MKICSTTENTEDTDGTQNRTSLVWSSCRASLMRFFPYQSVQSVVHTAIPSSLIGAR
jgi:hypothetical protein